MQAADALINQAVQGMFPGVEFSPRASSFNVPYPSDFGRPLISGTGEVPLEYSSAFQTFNYTVSYEHTMVPWRDNEEFYISPGSLMFHQKHSAKTGEHLYADCTLATVNRALRDCFDRATAGGMPDEVKEKDFDEKYAAYRRMQKMGVPDPENDSYKKFDDAEFRYLAAYNVVDSFNFLGVCLTRNDTTDNPEVYTNLYRARHANNVSFVPQGEVRVANVWGGPLHVRSNTELYLVLKKKEPGHFRIVPHISPDGRPPLDFECYWYVGRVKYEAEMTPSPLHVDRATFHRDPISAYKAVEALPRILINVGI